MIVSATTLVRQTPPNSVARQVAQFNAHLRDSFPSVNLSLPDKEPPIGSMSSVLFAFVISRGDGHILCLLDGLDQ